MSESPQASAFVISLEHCWDPGSAYRTQNSPGQIQREHLVDRGSESDLTVQGDLVKVIHGHMSTGGDPATLIVAEFRFISSDNSQRFREATIELLFAETNSEKSDGARDPKLVKIAPFGKYSMNPTGEECSETRSVGITAGMPGSLASLGANATWQLSKSLKKEYHASLSGVMRIEGRNNGSKNLARWSLLENPSTRDGIATFLRSAILIRRDSYDYFTARIKVEAGVGIRYGLRSALQSLLGKTPKDDPVIFDPRAEPLGDLPEGMDRENLGNYDIMKLISVEYAAPL